MTDSQLDRYCRENLQQPEAESDPFTVERYRQFARHVPARAARVLDVGCSTGRGGLEIATAFPAAELWGIDVVQERLDRLPAVYRRRVCGMSTDIPVEDGSIDVVMAGEFIEHLTPRDVDPTLYEFHRVLAVGGRLLLTTPNPGYLRLRLTGMSVYGPGHLTQHHAGVLKLRLRMHGFTNVRILGSGRISRYLGTHVPVRACYGSYLVRADKR